MDCAAAPMAKVLGVWVQARLTVPGSTGTVTEMPRVPRNMPSGAEAPTWNRWMIQPAEVGVQDIIARPLLSVSTGSPTVRPSASSRYTGTPAGFGTDAYPALEHADW